MKTNNPKIGFISLGCAKALIDSEKILTQLRAEGYQIVPDYAKADLIVINTCGFINEAIQESLGVIGEALKENGKVIIMGCLGVKKDVILKKYPKVLKIFGTGQNDQVLQAIHKYLPRKHDPRFDLIPKIGVKLTPPHYAYLKISEGCNYDCTFCIIPQLRGPLVSRPLPEILQEAKNLVTAGVKEIIVIAQDTAAYGNDLNDTKSNLFNLANELGKLDCWIRLHYLYPHPSIDKIIPLMHDHKILPYLDAPLQQVNARILKLMKRPAHLENLLKRIEHWRELCPDITIRSTFLVGFPGETELEFRELLKFLEMAQLDRVGCFKYSPVEGAKANSFPDQIPENIKEERLQQLMLWQEKISTKKLKQKIGKTIPILIDEVTETQTIGRSMGDSPEIDGRVIILDKTNLKPGNFVDVTIEKSDSHDLFGKIN